MVNKQNKAQMPHHIGGFAIFNVKSFTKTMSATPRTGIMFLLLGLVLLAACGQPEATPTNSPVRVTPTPTLEPTPTATPQPTTAPTPTSAPTATNSPTPTPKPTPTPVPPTKPPTALPTMPPTALPTMPPTLPPPPPVETATPEPTKSAAKKDVLAGGLVGKDEIDKFTLCAMGRLKKCTMEPAIERGLFETGLRPRFPDTADCRDIDDHWAIDYTAKRKGKEYYHGGIDMPAPSGTPIIAAADGTIIGKFLGEGTPRGIEIVLRHSPQDTGLPVWTYTQYTHFSEMPKQEVGQRVNMGEVLGPTGNSGIDVKTGKQSERRRTAIHFAVFYNTRGNYAVLPKGDYIIPAEGKWMDPNAMFRLIRLSTPRA